MRFMGGNSGGGPGLVLALLGPVEIGRSGGVMGPVPQPRQRVLLALLGVAAGRVVSSEALVEGLWGEEWSPGRELNLHSQVSGLRRRLEQVEPGGGGARLTRAGPGYRLGLGPGELDVEVFGTLAARGRDAARTGDAAAARELFEAALGLWRGAALGDAAPLCRRLAGEARRLEELRLAVAEERAECDLALGRHGEVAGELAVLVAEFPLRERLAALLMIAMYRCGRRGEALAVFDDARRVLAGQLGLDPGPELAALQARVLADDPALSAPTPALHAAAPGGARPPEVASSEVVPRQLPAGTGFFAGREAELKELDALLGEADGVSGVGRPAGAVVISAVAGMAGVGKTALAVHWARREAERFPDGQLYANMRGFDPQGAAVSPEEAAGWFLVSLGVPASQIPAEPQARFGLYRSVLASRRVLIVLDNVRDASQARPLLPGGGGCLVIVTSRSALVGLAAAEGARPLRLGPLGADEAVRLLAARLGPERVAAEPAAVSDLVARCEGLPLALAVTAARAGAEPGLPLAVLAGELARAAVADAAIAAPSREAAGAGPGRLDVLETWDAATSLRELLSWSCRRLSPPAAQMFAMLGVHCGPHITVPAAASLAGVPVGVARLALGELAEASLVAEHRPGRYVMHDLVRGYAAEQARQGIGAAGIGAAVGRSLDHYLHTMASFAYDFPWVFTPAPPAQGVIPEQLAGEAELMDWAQAEHQVLLRATAQAAAEGLIAQATQIFTCQTWFLGGQGYWADCQAAGQAVLAAARALGDEAAQGWTHATIGTYCTIVGAHDEGRAHQAQALGHFLRAGDLPGQAWARLFASHAASWKGGDWAYAITSAEEALALFVQVGDQKGEGWALAGLASGHAYLGNNDRASSYARRALQAAPESGDPMNLALAQNVLGLVHSRLGEYQEAISCFRHAEALARQRKTPLARKWLASLLTDFGAAHRAAGDKQAACQAWEQALQILDDLHMPDDRRIRARIEEARQASPPG